MSHSQHLNKASGLFFFLSFMLSKLQYIPIPIVANVFRLCSFLFSLTAYSTWFSSNLLNPDHKPLHNEWYGFARIKELLISSSIVGFAAAVLSFSSLFVPILFPIAAWLFVVDNIIWSIGEVHKLKSPPTDNPNFSYTQQDSYLSYAIATTGISIVTAMTATLIFIFPLMTLSITLFSILICIGIGVIAMESWLDANFGTHNPISTNSYVQIEKGMELEVTSEKSPTPYPAPYHGKSPLSSVEPGRINIERLEDTDVIRAVPYK